MYAGVSRKLGIHDEWALHRYVRERLMYPVNGRTDAPCNGKNEELNNGRNDAFRNGVCGG